MNAHKDIQLFLQSRRAFGIKPGLERVNALLATLNHPEKELNVIHVTGTNGKGSTITYLNNCLIHNDYKVGVFSSPSMTDVYGHIKINDFSISEKDFSNCLQKLMPTIEKLDHENNHPSEFEIITVIAFNYFYEKQVDIALIETGMGARLDTTNCLNPILSIITSIAVDHTSFLGSTIEQITKEKIGIMKENVPTIVGDVPVTSKLMIKEVANELQAPLHLFNDHFWMDHLDKQTVKFRDDDYELSVRLKMLGTHQFKNAALALKALILLKEFNYSINLDIVLLSLKETIVPGRFETIGTNPTIIIDGAHNEESMKALINTVKISLSHKQVELIFASFKDKQLTKIAPLLEDHFSNITVTTFNHERAETVENLANYFKRPVNLKLDWKQLVKRIRANENEKTFIITGSIHFIFLVRQYLLKIDS